MGLIVIDARVKIKRSNYAETVPAFGGSADHTDGSWDENDIYTGEFYFNVPDRRLWIGGLEAPEELAFKSDIPAAELLYVERTFTPDELKDMADIDNDDRYEVVAAGGAGTYYMAELALFELDFGTVAFNSGTAFFLTNCGVQADLQGSQLIDQAEDYVFPIGAMTRDPSNLFGERMSTMSNQPIEFQIEEQGNFPNVGDGTLTLKLWYRKLTFGVL